MNLATAILDLLLLITPGVREAATIARIIQTLTELVPIVMRTAKDLAPTLKNVIGILRQNTEITKEQLDDLDAIEAKIDAEFDAAATQAQAEDAPADRMNIGKSGT